MGVGFSHFMLTHASHSWGERPRVVKVKELLSTATSPESPAAADWSEMRSCEVSAAAVGAATPARADAAAATLLAGFGMRGKGVGRCVHVDA